LADKVVVLHGGHIEQVGSPMELYHHPDNKFVAGFLGMPKMSFLDGVVAATAETGVEVELNSGVRLEVPVQPDGVKAGDKVSLGVRPEHMTVNTDGSGQMKGRIDVSEQLGSDTYCYVKTLANEAITVRTPGGYAGTFGDEITLDLDLSQCHLFDKDGQAIHKIKRAVA